MKRTIVRVVMGLVALAYCVFSPGGGWLGTNSLNVLAAPGEDLKTKDHATRAEDIQGELEVIVEEGEDGWRTLYYLKTGEKVLLLHFAMQPQQNLQTGMKVTVRGTRKGDEIAASDLVTADSGGSSALTDQAALSVLSNTTGEQKVIVILVNFQDLQTQPYTMAQAQDVAFNQVSNFYRENSYGQTWLTGDVFGWFTIPVSSTSCDTASIATYAKQAAAGAGANLAAYNHYVYAFPLTNACGFSGRGTLGGSPSEAWINTNSIGLPVLGHELGHNFGLFHARSMDCGDAVIGGTCTVDEYGDKWDIMGATMPVHFNIFQKERLGWVNYGSSPPLQTVTASGNYWIDAYETVGSGNKGLKILRSTDPVTGVRTWYYLEHRTPTGYDSYLSAYNLQNGIVFHSGSESSGQEIYLLDMTPATLSWYDSALLAGQSYTDSTAGVTIAVLSADSTGAWVQVNMASQPCAHANPSVTVTPGQTQWLSSGSMFTYSVTVTNNDGSGCPTGSFNLAANAPVGWSASYSTTSLSIAPGSSASVSLYTTSPIGTSDGMYNVSAAATNATYSGGSSATYSIVTALGVSASSSSSTYTRSQKATVTAVVQAGGSPIAGANVTFTMTKSNGSIVTQTITTASNGSAVFSYSLNKRKDPTGTYQVKAVSTVNGLTGQGTTSFLVNR